MQRHLKELLGTTAIYSAGSLLTQLVSFLLLPLYTRYLTPADYGTLSLLLIAQTVLALFSEMAVASGVFRFYHAAADEPARRRLVATAVTGLLVTSGVLLALVQAFAGPLAALAFAFDDASRLLRLVSITAACTPFVVLLQRLLQVQSRPFLFLATSFLQFLTSVVVTIVLVVHVRLGVLGVIVGQLSGSAVVAVVALARLSTYLRAGVDRALWRKLLGFSAPLVPTSLMALVIAMSDRFFIERLSTLHQVGLYSVADKMTAVLSVFLIVPFSQAWNQFAFAHQSDADIHRTFARTFHLYAVGSAVMVVGFGLVIRNLLTLATTPTFASAWAVVPLLCAAPIAQGYLVVLASGIHLANRTKLIPPMFLVGATVNIALNFVLIPPLGLLGAALATAAAVLANVVVYFVVSRRVFAVTYPVWPAVGATFAATVSLLLYVRFESDDWLVSVPLRLGCAALFVALLFATRAVRRDDLRALMRGVSSLRARLAARRAGPTSE